MGIQENQAAERQQCRMTGMIEGLYRAKAIAAGHNVPFVEPRHIAELIQREIDDLDKEVRAYDTLTEQNPNILPFTINPQA